MWAQIFGAATLFGVIVAIAAWVNGRRTTRIISALINKMDERAGERHKEVTDILSNQTKILQKIEVDERAGERHKEVTDILSNQTKILQKIEARLP